MSGQPYILFTVVGHETGVSIAGWNAHRARLLTAPTEAPRTQQARHRGSVARRGPRRQVEPMEQGVIWRLFSALHRDLGCSAVAFETFAAAHADALRVVRRAERLTLVRTDDAEEGITSWFVSLDRRPIFMSNRWWNSWRDRDKQLETIVPTLASAQIAESLDDVVRGSNAARSRLPAFEAHPRLRVPVPHPANRPASARPLTVRPLKSCESAERGAGSG